MKNKIYIKFARIGGRTQTIELCENSKVSDIQKSVSIKKGGGSFYGKGKKLDPSTVLKDGDIIVYAFSIRGEATVRRHGIKWEIHKGDRDLFPSDFHAHNYENNEVVDLYSGIIYRKGTKEPMAKLSKKDHTAILKELLKSKEQTFINKVERVLIN